jgi:peptide/nickel transport system permease protein
VAFHLLPVSGRITYGLGLSKITGFNLIDGFITGNWAAFWNSLKHLILPALALGARSTTLTMRVTRASLLDVLSRDYIKTAKAKGLRNSTVLIKHGLRNALIPTVTVTALNIGVLLGGNMIIETVFGWPGIGRLVVESVFVRDYPVVQGCVFVYAITYIIMNLWADTMYALLNPKIRY